MATRRRGHGEGSIFQRKTDGRWIGQVDLGWSDGKRQRRYVTGHTRREVQDRIAKLLSDYNLGVVSIGGRVTTGAFLRTWLDEIARPRVRPMTMKSYIGLTSHWSDLDKIPLEKLSASHVQRVLNAKASSGLSPRTVHHMRAVLRTALNAAIKRQLVSRNAASLAEPPRVERSELVVLTPELAASLLTAIRGDGLEVLIKVALALGLRLGEALGLRWPDVDLEAGTLRLLMLFSGSTTGPPSWSRSQRPLEGPFCSPPSPSMRFGLTVRTNSRSALPWATGGWVPSGISSSPVPMGYRLREPASPSTSSGS